MSLTVLIPNQNIRSEGLPYEQTVQKKQKNLTTVVFHQIYLLILQTKQTNKQTLLNTKPKNDNMITKYV